MNKHQSPCCAFGLDDCPNRKAETADGVMSARPGMYSQRIMIYIASGIWAGRQRGASLRFIWLFVPVLPPPLKLFPLQLADRPSSRSSVCTHVTGSFKEGGYPSFRFFRLLLLIFSISFWKADNLPPCEWWAQLTGDGPQTGPQLFDFPACCLCMLHYHFHVSLHSSLLRSPADRSVAPFSS